MKRKLNKKKIAIIILFIIMFITIPIFARYIYSNVKDVYLKSRNFSFSSNLLSTTAKTYQYANWSGIEDYELDFKLYSYENELSLFTYEGSGLGYTLTCTVSDPTKATAHIGSVSGASTNSSYIPNATNVKSIKVYLKPIATLTAGETLTLTVSASTEKPYKKTISARFNIKITEEVITYKIEDSYNDVCATLKLLNPETTAKQVKLSFNPQIVMIDTSDEYYINRVTQTTNASSEITSVTITLGPEVSKNIKFYKKNKYVDYTYPGSYASMVVTVTE